MVTGMWGKKIGMTQIFVDDQVVPVTAIDVSNWYVTAICTKEKNGYTAVQIGCVRDRYKHHTFSAAWLHKPSKYFRLLREIRMDQLPDDVKVGNAANFAQAFAEGILVDVTGISKGRGYAGTIKRHGFGGAPSSHGSKMGRRPGSLSWMRSHGRVIKGKRLSGHMGVDQHVLKNLRLVKNLSDNNVVLIKGSVPGHSGSFVFIRKVLD